MGDFKCKSPQVRMKTHRNAERLIGYLREQHQPVTVTRVAIAGVMNRRDASDAMQYGVRQGAIERIKVPGSPVPVIRR
ncbi:hypothetical protein [Paraburkholderia kururiensis]|uniref:hypothetical protein n=1 Tax=Paraburkholderia kururiensis TaxID=984307 RepID=UPI0018F70BDA|nr:hypothetical protein [Paraburkholderia kururiensis]